MFRPDLIVEGVHQVSAQLLRELGVRGVLVDLDDTLLPAAGDSLGAEVEPWLAGLTEAGFAVAILSNGERARVAAWAARLGIAGTALAGKPSPLAFARALRRLGTAAPATAMVGDQLFTDVLGANLAGLVSILVRPLSPGKLPHTRIARRLERIILRGGDGGGSVHR